MRKALRSFLAWLDRRFPEKVVVTQADYLTLKAQIETMAKILEKHSEERLKTIENEIQKFNVALGFGGINAKLGAGAFQR